MPRCNDGIILPSPARQRGQNTKVRVKMATDFRHPEVVLILAALALVSAAAHAAAAVTSRFEVFEAELTTARTYANPFLDVTVTAEFAAPDDKDWTLLLKA